MKNSLIQSFYEFSNNPKILALLIEAYTEDHRSYHNLLHIQEMVPKFSTSKMEAVARENMEMELKLCADRLAACTQTIKK